MNDTTIVLCLLAFVFGYLISSHLNMTIEGAGCDKDTNLKFYNNSYYPKKYFDENGTFIFDKTPNGCLKTTKNCEIEKCFTDDCNDICKFNEDPTIDPKNRNKCEIKFKDNSGGGCIEKGTDEMYLRNTINSDKKPPVTIRPTMKRQTAMRSST